MVVSLHRITNVNTMAKGYGLTGKIQGKIGSKVYRIEAGEQIISEYNPNKQDPKSEKQLVRRSKMVEANRVSKFFPWETIVGYGPNRSRARNAFMSELVSLAQTSQVNGDIKSTINLADVQLSKGVPVLLGTFSLTTVSPQNKQYVNASVQVPTGLDVVGFLLVVIYSPAPDVEPYRAYYAMSTALDVSRSCSATVVLSDTGSLGAGTCYAYAIPLLANTLKKRVRYSEVVEVTAQGNMTTTAWVSLARADLFTKTQYLGTINFG